MTLYRGVGVSVLVPCATYHITVCLYRRILPNSVARTEYVQHFALYPGKSHWPSPAISTSSSGRSLISCAIRTRRSYISLAASMPSEHCVATEAFGRGRQLHWQHTAAGGKSMGVLLGVSDVEAPGDDSASLACGGLLGRSKLGSASLFRYMRPAWNPMACTTPGCCM